VLKERIDGDHITIAIGDEIITYKHMTTVEFTSARKRMSVIVRDPQGCIIVYTKGADSIVYSLLDGKVPSEKFDYTQAVIDAAAQRGLRTLVCARKEITESEFYTWKIRYDEAFVDLEHRDVRVAEVGAEIEYDFDLLGSVSFEDQLQPNVAQTIAFLARMKVSVCVNW
jgi:magnesium-transporting ATPase (P-type)